MARRRVQEEHENHERWLVSYADFITLLFAFFVVMYSVSSVNEGKFRVLADSLVASFQDRNKSLEPIQIGKLVRSPVVDNTSLETVPLPMQLEAPPVQYPERADLPENESVGSDTVKSGEGETDGSAQAPVEDPVEGDAAPPAQVESGPETVAEAAGGAPGEDAAGKGEGAGEGDGAAAESARIDRVEHRVRDEMSTLIDEGLLAVRRGDRWLEVELKTSILFGSGQARLAASAAPVLAKLARILRTLPNPVQVEGFTDNVPISTAAFPSNWELSAARAASVVHLFAKQGVSPTRMAAIGFGEHRPVANNSSDEGRRRNRRVVVVVGAPEGGARRAGFERMGDSAVRDRAVRAAK